MFSRMWRITSKSIKFNLAKWAILASKKICKWSLSTQQFSKFHSRTVFFSSNRSKYLWIRMLWNYQTEFWNSVLVLPGEDHYIDYSTVQWTKLTFKSLWTASLRRRPKIKNRWKDVLIPHILVISTDLHFDFEGMQFPVSLPFTMVKN